MIANNYSRKFILVALCLCLLPALATAGNNGLSKSALKELKATGLDKYLGEYQPVSSEDVGDGWTRHTFDPAAGNGPICIDGSEYAVFTRQGKKKKKLLIMLQGGGACWQDFYQCNTSLDSDTQQPPFERQGIWDFDNKTNPLAQHSVLFMPYCDGSVFIGDNEVNDPAFPGNPIRYHRGLRNLSAGLDVAKAALPRPRTVVLAGTSAGGVGAATLAPLMVRLQYGNKLKKFFVLNDAGPVVANPLTVDAALARSNDWAFGQYYPPSCIDCDDLGQPTALIMWRLANDSKVRDAFYGTDGDATDIGFVSANFPGSPFLQPFDPENGVFGLNQLTYRQLFVPELGKIHAAYPKRFKRFVVSGDDSHTAIQRPLFYEQRANDALLNEWVWGFINGFRNWVDIVEPYQPVQ